ncbi:hypothetical protein A1D23_13010 [Chelonobacter oris]|uniref:hypothetical protein n=1 Tax=Chelonobacter oris TaxID=505317 RepID=UPI00244D53C2|nr:hypothetical protein [Chelonobacter oris]MDH3001459.1 hypothetical protein [Chelonobacter oris]
MKNALFDVNISTGDIIVNPQYKSELDRLAITIIDMLKINKKTTAIIQLNYWSYRINTNHIAHSLEFGRDDNEDTYILTLTEVQRVEFNAFSFFSSEGEIYLYDSVDVSCFIHYVNAFFKERKIKLDCAFLNRCNLQGGPC